MQTQRQLGAMQTQRQPALPFGAAGSFRAAASRLGATGDTFRRLRPGFGAGRSPRWWRERSGADAALRAVLAAPGPAGLHRGAAAGLLVTGGARPGPRAVRTLRRPALTAQAYSVTWVLGVPYGFCFDG